MKSRMKNRRGRKSGRKGNRRPGRGGYYIVRGKGFGSRRRATARFHRQNKRSRRADRRRTSRTVINLPPKNMREKKELARWYYDPSHADVKGVDTKFKAKKNSKKRRSKSRAFGRSRNRGM